MSINSQQLQMLVIRPILQRFNLWSYSAENLLLGTCAQESQMGTYLKQIMGEALGIYQMEPPTHDDLWLNSINSDLRRKLRGVFPNLTVGFDPYHLLIVNLEYATIMARIKYLTIKEALPDAEDIAGLAKYYKRYYNSSIGKATEEQFISNYHRYVKKIGE